MRKRSFISIVLILIFVLYIPAAFGQNQSPAETEHAEEEHHESPWTVVFRWANFVILFGGVGYMLRQPVRDYFESRSRAIAEGLQQARRAQQEAGARMAEIERKLGALSAEMAAFREQAERDARAERERVLAEARRDVDRIIEQSRQEIERMVRSLERDIKEHVADLVIANASQTLSSQMTEDDQNRVVLRFVRNL